MTRCARCRRPTAMCYCALAPRLPTRTRVLLLQHTRERDMAHGTARMASLCLPQAELHVGVDWGGRAPVVRALADPARPAILLYPGPDAVDILAAPPTGPVTLVVVDGTWAQARRVVRDNPILQALPRYGFVAPTPSRYRLRREPAAAYCSTIEALAHVLGVLEGDPARFQALLAPFEAMIDAQLACEASGPAQRHRPMRPRPAARVAVPTLITERWADLVCVVGEPDAWPMHLGAARPADRLARWLACRPSTGEVFDQIAAVPAPLAPSTLAMSELTSAQLAAGATLAELRAGFAAFVRPTDVVCAWGPRAPALFTAAGGVLPAAALDLRAVAQRQVQTRVGALEDHVGPTPPLAAGRGGRRLAMLDRLVRGWRDQLLAAGA